MGVPDRDWTLLVASRLPPNVAERAALTFNVRMPEKPGLRDWLVANSTDSHAVLCTPGHRIDADLIARLGQAVRVIGTFSVGHDHIDVAAAQARGIIVVHTPGVVSRSAAEFTMGMILAAARRIGEAERLVRAERWHGWAPADFLGIEVSGKRLGIFGMGRIGRVLAGIARAGFGMEVHYLNRTRLAAEHEAGAAFHAEEEPFLAASQVLCLLAPGGAATDNWLDARRLAALPRRAIVVNTARGTLVDDAALAEALRSGHVAAAALDVFPREPHIPDVYEGLENVVLTPHIATATQETRDLMGHMVLDGIEDVLAGRTPRYRVAV